MDLKNKNEIFRHFASVLLSWSRSFLKELSQVSGWDGEPYDVHFDLIIVLLGYIQVKMEQVDLDSVNGLSTVAKLRLSFNKENANRREVVVGEYENKTGYAICTGLL